MLEAAPDEDRLRAKVRRAIVDIPRLGQRVVSAPLRIAPPQWQADPTLDLDYHLRRVSAPPPGGMRELLDLAALLSAAPLDRSRPLWEFTLVEGLEGGRAALLQRVHHTITDGVGGLKLSLSLVDFEAEPDEPVLPIDLVAPRTREPERRRPDAPRRSVIVTDALGFARRARPGPRRPGPRRRRRTRRPPDVGCPRRSGESVRLAGSLRRQVLVTQAARSPLLAARSLGRRFEVFSVPLDETHRAAKALGGSLNDCYVAGGRGRARPVPRAARAPRRASCAWRCRSARVEHADAAANRFAPSRVMVPVGPDDPADPLRASCTTASPASATNPRSPQPTPSPSSSPSSRPRVLVTATRSQARTIDFATSNLRGSPVDLFVGGARILANYPMGPRAGCALNVTMLSYCGDLHMGLNIDPAAVTEPDTLLDCFDEAFTSSSRRELGMTVRRASLRGRSRCGHGR